MSKTAMPTIAAKNAVVDKIIDALDTRSGFLMIGHETPDEDCIAGMVAFALLATKFEKNSYICLRHDLHEHFEYLLKICRHNSIHIIDGTGREPLPVDTIVICDTPKPDMMEYGEAVKPLMENNEVVRIEFDHHLEADSEYCGSDGYCLVDEASSSCELIGYLTLKLRHRQDLIDKYDIFELLSRNIILAILTGIIGDSKMGKYLKTEREKRFYRFFSDLFSDLLEGQTTESGNLSNQVEVFSEIGRLSKDEGQCFRRFIEYKRGKEHVGYAVLNERESMRLHKKFAYNTVVAVSRAVADVLAEESGYLSLVAFYDQDSISDLIQFRMRRSQSFKSYDLRNVLKLFGISNGGGHEGAIAFRFPRSEIDDLESYIGELLAGVEQAIGGLT
jgi:nanoRNase/pAp phosphatase (c-di-AMP/oligoRNAs hydrolase)